MIDRSFVDKVCETLPGAEKSDILSGEHDAWKIGGKMFACIGSSGNGVSVKCRDIETASMLIEAGVADRAPYFHKSWVRLNWETPETELQQRLERSYDIIRSSLTKKLQASLPKREAN